MRATRSRGLARHRDPRGCCLRAAALAVLATMSRVKVRTQPLAEPPTGLVLQGRKPPARDIRTLAPAAVRAPSEAAAPPPKKKKRELCTKVYTIRVGADGIQEIRGVKHGSGELCVDMKPLFCARRQRAAAAHVAAPAWPYERGRTSVAAPAWPH
jgi:hypothetical protein